MLASDPDVGSSFEYEGRGRDIFTYGEAPKDLPKEARTILDEGIPRLKGVPRPPVDGDKLLREAYASYWKATGDFLEHDYLDAVKECEKALGRLKGGGRQWPCGHGGPDRSRDRREHPEHRARPHSIPV